LASRLRRIEEKLEIIAGRLDSLERVVREGRQDQDVADLLFLVRRLIRFYSRYVWFMEEVSRLKSLPQIAGDDISMHIVEVLAEKGSLNISQITEEVRRRRGKASRGVVSKRLEYLRSEGIVEEVGGGEREKRYSLTRSLRARLLRL